MLIMVSLNLFCFVWASNYSSINDNRKIIIGTHWNRIGKRLYQNLESRETKLCRDLMVLKHLVGKFKGIFLF